MINSRPKLCCLITGEVRRNSFDIIRSLSKRVDLLVWSTWEDQEVSIIELENLVIVRNKYPSNFGYGNRNIQRLCVNAGLNVARERDCTHVLKWRTDLLIYNFNFEILLDEFEKKVKFENKRLLYFTSYWRMLTVAPDWFSSLPDLIMFSRTEWMDIMWSDEGFNYDLGYNFPSCMVKDLGLSKIESSSFVYNGRTFTVPLNYDTHSELYAWFKFRVQNILNLELNHEQIVKSFFLLKNLEDMNIIWFQNSKRLYFRPLSNSFQFPWWNEKVFNSLLPVKVMEVGWGSRPQSAFDRFNNKVKININVLKQRVLYTYFRIKESC